MEESLILIAYYLFMIGTVLDFYHKPSLNQQQPGGFFFILFIKTQILV